MERELQNMGFFTWFGKLSRDERARFIRVCYDGMSLEDQFAVLLFPQNLDEVEIRNPSIRKLIDNF